mmetsp:Transcript_29409/g.46123  ORF Transcript_29409/g.46123 Transcript_29409/m.46123 type:complete len:249 (-) Transcript_29409:32-778(-)
MRPISCLPAEGGGNLEGLSEERKGGNLGSRESGGVGNAGLEVRDLGDELNRALAGEEVVLHHSSESDHAKAAVLDLGNSAAVRLEAEGVEAVVTSSVKLAVDGLLDERELKSTDEEENLGGSADGDELVVESPDLLASVPLSVEREGEEVLNDQTGGGKHSDTSVLDLGLTSPDDVRPSEDATVLSPVRGLDVVAAGGLVGEAVLHGGATGGGGTGGGGLGENASGGHEGGGRGHSGQHHDGPEHGAE